MTKCPVDGFNPVVYQRGFEAGVKSVSSDATAWLIEFSGQGEPTYYGKTDEGLGMTTDHQSALRFARQADADTVIDDIGWTRPNAQAVEHMWCGPKFRHAV
jgi:hypothetical protein